MIKDMCLFWRGIKTIVKKLLQFIVNEETILYLVFGVLTTIVNFVTFMLFDYLIGGKYYLISNVISFIFATLFAFVTNKQLVFKSKSWEMKITAKELLSFIAARISTFLIVEEVGLLVAVEFLKVDDLKVYLWDGKLLAKIILAFVTVIINYIFSKCLIFQKDGKEEA